MCCDVSPDTRHDRSERRCGPAPADLAKDSWTPSPGGSGDSEEDPIVSMDFVYVPPGSFVMGGTSTEDGRFKCVDVPHHPVTITRGFYMGKHPVTQAQYEVLMKKNPSKSTKDEWCPVDNIGADDAFSGQARAHHEAGSQEAWVGTRVPTVRGRHEWSKDDPAPHGGLQETTRGSNRENRTGQETP